MSNEPEGNAALQYVWSKCRTEGIRNGAKHRVKSLVADIGARGWDMGRVLVIGPQHGFELEQFRDCGVEAVGIDTVPEFVTDCTELGFRCEHIPAERMTEVIDGKWNVYASHSLEHCYDINTAVEQLLAVLDKWCYMVSPIEPLGHRPLEKEDKAHLSRFRDRQSIHDAMAPLVCAKQDNHKTMFEGLFIKPKS